MKARRTRNPVLRRSCLRLLAVLGASLSVLAVALAASDGAAPAASPSAARLASAPVPAGLSPSPSVSTAAVIDPAIPCSSLKGIDFTTVQGAPTQISSATLVTSNGAAYCDVTGYIAPQTQFDLLLPTTMWHGDYVQEGCGGLCGNVSLGTPSVSQNCPQVVNNEVAIAADNAGHQGSGGAWGANDPTLRAVLGYSSEHSLALASKAIIKAFYGRGPTYSYFDGCSTGGRQALMLAQRYPSDFNGILAGSPTIFESQLTAELHIWEVLINTDAQGNEILTSNKLPALHAAVQKTCANSQGLILDPRACTFNPASIQCAPGTDSSTCLTPAQVNTVREAYLGPTDPQGGSLYPGGEPYGSELAWAGAWVTAGPDWPSGAAAASLAVAYMKFAFFPTNPPTSFTLSDWKFTRAYFEKLTPVSGIYNATDPNLTQFRNDGGKIIIYQGWEDQLVPPFGTVAYYNAVAKYMGGYEATQQFSRLYMIPAQYHCLGGGDPQVSANFLSPLIDWVQHGVAPGSVTMPVIANAHPYSPTTITVSAFNPTIPVHAQGSLNDNYTKYIGGFKSGYELWCSSKSNGADGMSYSCSHRRPSAPAKA